MFSNDRNVETISQLVDVCKHYIGLQTEYVKLDVIEKVVRLITVLTLALSLTIVLVLALIYVSFAAAYALEPHVGLPLPSSSLRAVIYSLLCCFSCSANNGFSGQLSSSWQVY